MVSTISFKIEIAKTLRNYSAENVARNEIIPLQILIDFNQKN